LAKVLKWQAMDIDLHAFMELVRSKGAASINEIKQHFHTDSASIRKVAGFLWHHDKVWVLGHGRGVYIAENTHKKGSVSVPNLRHKAGVVEKKRGPKPRLPEKPSRPTRTKGTKLKPLTDLEKALIRQSVGE